jgi:hypothetical protein
VGLVLSRQCICHGGQLAAAELIEYLLGYYVVVSFRRNIRVRTRFRGRQSAAIQTDQAHPCAVEALKREIALLQHRLPQAEVIMDVQKSLKATGDVAQTTRQVPTELIAAATQGAPAVGVMQACRVLRVSRATLYRRRAGGKRAAEPRPARREPYLRPNDKKFWTFCIPLVSPITHRMRFMLPPRRRDLPVLCAHDVPPANGPQGRSGTP